MDYVNGGVWNNIEVVITEEEGGKEVARVTIEQDKSETFTLYPKKYVITATAVSPIFGTITGTEKNWVSNKQDKKYEVRHNTGLYLYFKHLN